MSNISSVLRAKAENLARESRELFELADKLDGHAPEDESVCGFKNAARICGDSVAAIRGAWRRGALPGRKVGKNVVFSRADIDERRLAIALRSQSMPEAAATHGHSRPLSAGSDSSDDSIKQSHSKEV